jgi:hypothetical protein
MNLNIGMVGNIQFDAVLQLQAMRDGNFSQTWAPLQAPMQVCPRPAYNKHTRARRRS